MSDDPTIAEWGGMAFEGRDARPGERMTSAVWSVFPDDSRYFDPSPSRFMINFRVDESEFGRFGWVMAPEGNRLELWEPPRVREEPMDAA